MKAFRQGKRLPPTIQSVSMTLRIWARSICKRGRPTRPSSGWSGHIESTLAMPRTTQICLPTMFGKTTSRKDSRRIGVGTHSAVLIDTEAVIKFGIKPVCFSCGRTLRSIAPGAAKKSSSTKTASSPSGPGIQDPRFLSVVVCKLRHFRCSSSRRHAHRNQDAPRVKFLLGKARCGD